MRGRAPTGVGVAGLFHKHGRDIVGGVTFGVDGGQQIAGQGGICVEIESIRDSVKLLNLEWLYVSYAPVGQHYML